VIIIGLTGSIGMGKSTTADMFRAEGCPVFDADATVHRLYAKGGAAVPIIRAVFPDAIENGAVNRQTLGRHMRADPLQLEVLESFIHPLVGKERRAFFDHAEKAGQDIVVLDIPLLFETGAHEKVDKIVVVTAPAHIQKERVMARPGMNEDLFNTLLARQIPDSIKRQKADFLIFTDKGFDFAKEQVKNILKELRQTTETKVKN